MHGSYNTIYPQEKANDLFTKAVATSSLLFNLPSDLFNWGSFQGYQEY
jgi:hypothetical protein